MGVEAVEVEVDEGDKSADLRDSGNWSVDRAVLYIQDSKSGKRDALPEEDHSIPRSCVGC